MGEKQHIDHQNLKDYLSDGWTQTVTPAGRFILRKEKQHYFISQLLAILVQLLSSIGLLLKCPNVSGLWGDERVVYILQTYISLNVPWTLVGNHLYSWVEKGHCYVFYFLHYFSQRESLATISSANCVFAHFGVRCVAKIPVDEIMIGMFIYIWLICSTSLADWYFFCLPESWKRHFIMH